MFSCQFCGQNGPSHSETFQFDEIKKGFWCEICDGYTYLNNQSEVHRFTLLLENKNEEKMHYSRPDKKFNKRLSPYRYPGGKSKIIDYLYSHLQKEKSKKLFSPFTGGGSFELAMLEAGVVDQLFINDLDTGVYALWWCIKHVPYELIYRLNTIIPEHKDYFDAQELIKNDYIGVDLVEAAWSSLLVNRLAYSGVVKANPLGGRNGTKKNLLSRWNPDCLIKRINKIHLLSEKIEVSQENAVEFIEEAYWQDDATIFIDPPYVEKGKDLYHCYYTEKDHRELSFLLDSLHFGFSGADILVTYDYNKWLDSLYAFPNRLIVARNYSA
ncbi:DNA adenine methylase [Cytobacillus pseudoceanisediminis]|uniref:DNA adenine methylase n=1 Tax=Cytobacillus pseudoceanisediminis TaxID=3051614 RepID=UPI00366501CD